MYRLDANESFQVYSIHIRLDSHWSWRALFALTHPNGCNRTVPGRGPIAFEGRHHFGPRTSYCREERVHDFPRARFPRLGLSRGLPATTTETCRRGYLCHMDRVTSGAHVYRQVEAWLQIRLQSECHSPRYENIYALVHFEVAGGRRVRRSSCADKFPGLGESTSGPIRSWRA